MSKRIIVFFAVLFIGLQAFAQTTVSGVVSDEKGETLVGVNIQIKGTSNGTMTDLDGKWSLNNVNAKTVLVFSSIGYTTEEITVGTQRNIKVTLKEDNNFLDEVVVVGYGTARKKDVSGAISSVNYGSNKDIVNLPNPNALSALSSKVAGFSYSPTSSASGDNTSTMTIRGKNVIPTGGAVSGQGVNAPLLVVDGVLSYDSIQSINTNDIESIDVLKDASAAAIYGSRAANGVIIITTKKGTSQKPKVSFNASVSLSDWSRRLKMVTDDETFLKNIFYTKVANDDRYKGKTFEGMYADLDDAAYDLFGGSSISFQAYEEEVKTDWIDEISRVGVGQKYDLNVSGKSQNVTYYVSGNYTRQQGIRLGDDFEKYNFLAKMDINITDWLTFGVKGNFLSAHSWGQVAKIQHATWMSPYSYVYCQIPGYEDWYNSHPAGGSGGSQASPLWGNAPGASYLWTDRSSYGTNVNGVAYAQVDFPFLKGLSYRITMQGQYNTGNTDVFTNPEYWVSTDNTGQMSDPSQFADQAQGTSSFSRSNSWTIDNILTYSKDFGKHHADVMAGYTREHYNSEGLSVGFQGFDTPTFLGVYNIDASYGENRTMSRGRTVSSSIGYLARANYNFANTYYATFNFRRDGYSAFAEGHKWGNFFGASAAWVLSNENFIKNLGVFDFLKLRLSWGQNGSRSVNPYQTLASVGGTYTWLDNKSAYGFKPNGIPNKSLTWATVEKYDLGIDFSVLNSRVNGSIDLYTGQTTNMIVQRSVPYITGFTAAYDNVGKVTNKGIEFTVNTININGNGKDSFRWESNLVFDSNANKLVELFGPDHDGNEADDITNATTYGYDSYVCLQVGRPIGAGYDYKFLGVFQSQDEIDNYKSSDGTVIMPNAKPGDYKFEDYNNDGKIDADDRHYVGSPDPLFTLNFGNTLSWKNFSLYFNFRWAQGDKNHFLWCNPNGHQSNFGSGAQLADSKPWTEKNHSTTVARYGYQNTLGYNFWENRSFLKLKDLSFSYTFDQNFIKKVGLSNARVYVAATDLFTITKWSGLDPENGGTIASNSASDKYGSNGTYKTVTFGVNLTF